MKSRHDGTVNRDTPTIMPAQDRAVGSRRVLTRRRFLQTAVGGIVATCAYTGFVEPFWTEVVHQRLTSPKLPCELQGIRLVQLSDLRILRNEMVEVKGLQIVGLDDLWARRGDPAVALSRVDQTRPTLVLSHNPDSVDLGDWRGYRGWVLSGHTHGGQCKPPFLPPPLLPVRNRRYTAGIIPLSDGRTLYINRGLGYLHQVRFNVRPEITIFTLEGSRA